MNMPQEMPVYLFTGFLDAGKTTFIQDALESRDFNENEQTLREEPHRHVISCEMSLNIQFLYIRRI